MTEPSDGAAGATVVVVAGGRSLTPAAAGAMPEGAYVIAADSGVDHALAAGLPVHEAVGDFDSVTTDGLARAEAAGARIERHPVDKDETDLELAFVRAAARRPAHLLLLDGGGGRLDHLLANILALSRPDLAGLRPRAVVGAALVTVVHGGQTGRLSGDGAELVSLLPVHGSAGGVTTTGLRWPLADAVLVAGGAWGVSNRFVDRDATVRVDSGVLVAIQPEARRAA